MCSSLETNVMPVFQSRILLPRCRLVTLVGICITIFVVRLFNAVKFLLKAWLCFLVKYFKTGWTRGCWSVRGSLPKMTSAEHVIWFTDVSPTWSLLLLTSHFIGDKDITHSAICHLPPWNCTGSIFTLNFFQSSFAKPSRRVFLYCISS